MPVEITHCEGVTACFFLSFLLCVVQETLPEVVVLSAASAKVVAGAFIRAGTVLRVLYLHECDEKIL